MDAFLTVNEDSQLVRQGLQDLGADIPKVGRQGIFRTAQRIKTRLRIYPPERPDQTYVRTNTLKNSIEIIPLGDGYEISVDPISPKGVAYGEYVLGDAFGNGQAWMHVGIWTPFANVALEEIYKLPDDVVDELRLDASIHGLEVT